MSRLSTDYDRIVTSAPLDRQAAVVGAASGEGGELDLATSNKGGRPQWDAPLACLPVPPDVESWTGRKIGRLAVIGYLGRGAGHVSGAKARRWLVRCSCSAYETRREAALQAPAVEEMCGRCAYREKGNAILVAARTGKWPDGRPANISPGLNTSTGVRRLKDEASA